MPEDTALDTRIQQIRNRFNPSDLEGDPDQILGALNRFEKDSQRDIHHQGLAAVVGEDFSVYWYRQDDRSR